MKVTTETYRVLENRYLRFSWVAEWLRSFTSGLSFYDKLDKLDKHDIIKLDDKYRLIHKHFHIGLVIIPRPPYWARNGVEGHYWSRDEKQANMEMPMY
jgi:hypothetical protein